MIGVDITPIIHKVSPTVVVKISNDTIPEKSMNMTANKIILQMNMTPMTIHNFSNCQSP